MSVYTTQIRNYIESFSEGQDIPVSDKIEIGRPKLFDFQYPSESDEFKKDFETNFIRHFYFEEIGQETIGAFKMFLCDRLNLIMPYYNELYKTTKMELNPLSNYSVENISKRDISVSQTGTASGTNSASVSSNAKGSSNDSGENTAESYVSNFPQANIGKISLDYATTGNHADSSNSSTSSNTSSSETSSEDNSSSTQSSTGTTDETSTLKTSGIMNKSEASLLMEYRATFVRIYQMIFEECRDLFMLIY